MTLGSASSLSRSAANGVGRLLAPLQFRGKWRITKFTGEMLSRVSPEADCYPVRGARVSVSLNDRIGRLMWTGCYEPELIAFLRFMLEPGMEFVDVGAHVGYFSVIAAVLVGESGRVHSFEPDPDCFLRLTRNSRSYPSISVHRTAVADYQGEATFYRSNKRGETGWGTLFDDLAPRAKLSVPVCSLDTWSAAARIERIDLLKVDAEGAEFRVLQGGKTVLAAARPVIWMEANAECLSRDGKSVTPIVSLLTEWGFVAQGLLDLRSNSLMTIVAVPSERSALLQKMKRLNLGLRPIAADEA